MIYENTYLEENENGAFEFSNSTKELFLSHSVNYILQIKNSRAQIEAIEEEIKKLKNRKAHIEKNEEWLINKIKESMISLDVKKIGNDVHQAMFSKSSAIKVIVDDEKVIPQEFFNEKTYKILDKEALKEAFQNGEIVTGAHPESIERFTIR